jgi:hypothetical protein
MELRREIAIVTIAREITVHFANQRGKVTWVAFWLIGTSSTI